MDQGQIGYGSVSRISILRWKPSKRRSLPQTGLAGGG
jgi:hypothetical protein